MNGRGRTTVLVVEDDEAVRRIAVGVLTRGGYRVIAAGSGAEAVRACLSARAGVSLVLLDVELPDLRGPQLALLIQDLEPSARVLFMSALWPEDLSDVARVRHARFMAKPFAPEELLQAVDDAMSQAVEVEMEVA